MEEEIEPNPRIRTAGADPGCPFVVVVVTPGAIPSSACPTFEIGLGPNFSAVTFAEEPVKDAFFVVPKVVTTTSSNVDETATKETLITSLFPTRNSCGAYPTELTTKTAFGDTVSLKLPSPLEVVPLVVPLMTMLTPGRGEPSSPEILPEI